MAATKSSACTAQDTVAMLTHGIEKYMVVWLTD